MAPTLIFANPISGRGRAATLAHSLEKRLQSAGKSVRVFLQSPEKLPDDALASSSSVIVIGGDGTLRGVVGRLLQTRTAPPQAPPHAPPHSLLPFPPVLLVPMGTANLMAQHLGFRWPARHPEERILAALEARRLVHIDAATANGEPFLLMAGVGLDARIVHELHRQRTGPITRASYIRPLIQAFGRYAYPPLRVSVGGRVVFDTAPGVAFVANVAEYGTGFAILPQARADDGLLDVCVLPCRSTSDAMGHLLAAAAGEHLHGAGVVVTRGRKIVIDSPHPVPVQLDGEAAGHTPLEIGLLKGRIPFIVEPLHHTP
jgi:diacylglycerol kinase (ATP)